jgi:hypothetical protein
MQITFGKIAKSPSVPGSPLGSRSSTPAPSEKDDDSANDDDDEDGDDVESEEEREELNKRESTPKLESVQSRNGPTANPPQDIVLHGVVGVA